MAEFGKFDPAEEEDLLPGDPGAPLYNPDMAQFGGRQGLGMANLRLNDGAKTGTHDTVPLGEVDVRRGEPVFATDGEIGKIQGLVIDPGSHHVTHVLLEEGHLWGRKEVAIPISSVTRVDDVIRLTIDKQQVQDLPPVRRRPPRDVALDQDGAPSQLVDQWLRDMPVVPELRLTAGLEGPRIPCRAPGGSAADPGLPVCGSVLDRQVGGCAAEAGVTGCVHASTLPPGTDFKLEARRY